jgi:hypothetical protein
MRIFVVPGTHASYRGNDAREWWYPGDLIEKLAASPFLSLVIAPLGLTPIALPWSTDIDGTSVWPWEWFGKRNNVEWESWGYEFYQRMLYVPFEERIILSHSHGGNVWAYAAARIPIRLWIDIASPVRGDMKVLYERARANTQHWVHVHSDRSDWMQMLGGLFDRHLGTVRANPYAHENVFVPRRGHSRILNDEREFGFWRDSGISGKLSDMLTLPPPDPEMTSMGDY